MASLGYDMESGKIVAWLKKVGDPIERGEALVEIETDKATLEMESLHRGTLIEIIAVEGAEVEVGAVIGYVDEDS